MTNRHAFSISASDPQAGFSLVELAVAMVVIGILMGLALPFLQAHTQRSILLTTRTHQQAIHGALKIYQQTLPTQTLPCPGDPGAVGEERGIANCALRTQEGIVPYKTLGVPERLAKDGYNRYFTYVVEHNLTRPMDNFDTIQGGHVQVSDEKGNSVLDRGNPQNFISFLLISHGTTGGGAYDAVGERIPFLDSPPATKEVNANGLPHYQLGGEDHVYWVSQMVFRAPACPH